MKTIITFILTTLTFVSYSQHDFNFHCKQAEKKADSLITNDIIYFPRNLSEISLTFRKLLELEYGIQDELYDNGSDMSFGGESECFYSKMKLEIERKWGDPFLEQKKAEADQLDKEGLGFTEPTNNGITEFLKNQLREIELEYDGYYVNFVVDPDGTISAFNILTGVPRAFEITENSSDYKAISEAIRLFRKKYPSVDPIFQTSP